MNRRGYCVVSFLILILLLIGIIWQREAVLTLFREPVPVSSENLPTGTPLIEIVEDYSETPYAVQTISYPQFVGVDPMLNESIRQMIEAVKEEHVRASEDSWRGRFETASPEEDIPEVPPKEERYTFSVEWTPIQVSSDVLSIVFRYGGYSGGAHGYEKITTFNYDLKQRRSITLADLFPGNPEYLQTVSTQSIDLLKVHIAAQTGEDLDKFLIASIEQGAGPSEENFRHFTFTKDSIRIYFEEYQVGSYALGSQEVVLPRP